MWKIAEQVLEDHVSCQNTGWVAHGLSRVFKVFFTGKQSSAQTLAKELWKDQGETEHVLIALKIGKMPRASGSCSPWQSLPVHHEHRYGWQMSYGCFTVCWIMMSKRRGKTGLHENQEPRPIYFCPQNTSCFKLFLQLYSAFFLHPP